MLGNQMSQNPNLLRRKHCHPVTLSGKKTHHLFRNEMNERRMNTERALTRVSVILGIFPVFNLSFHRHYGNGRRRGILRPCGRMTG
jgi:hypothetical protein